MSGCVRVHLFFAGKELVRSHVVVPVSRGTSSSWLHLTRASLGHHA